MEPDAFEGALKELGLEPEREQFLRDEYAKRNTLSGQMLGAFQGATAPAEGMVRASIAPIIKPEGMSGIEAIRTGKAELAVPGFLTGAVEEPLRAMTTGEKVASGIDATQEELQQAAQMGAAVGTLGAGTRLGKPVDTSVVSSGGAGPKTKRIDPLSFFVKKEARTSPDSPDAIFGTKKLRDLFEEDQWDYTPVTDAQTSIDDQAIWDFGTLGDYNLTELGYARNLPIDTIAKYRLGQIDIQEVAESVGEDVSSAFTDYVDSRLNRLSNNPEFVDYLQRLKDNPSFDPWTSLDDSLAGKTVKGTATFKSPIPEVIDQMAWPAKGKEGYQIISELKSHPTVRKAELDTVMPEIDPKKRYTREEVQDLFKGNLWDTEVITLSDSDPNSKFTKWSGYQRQKDLKDSEKDYFELLINSERKGQPRFKAKGTHFDDQTLAHARASVREDRFGEYILPEELQTDLLQHGYEAPKPGIKSATPAEVIQNLKEELGYFDDLDKDILKIYAEEKNPYYLNFQSYQDFIEKVGASNLIPGATTEEVLAALNPDSKTYASEDLMGLYVNYKTGGKYAGWTTPATEQAWDLYDSIRDAYNFTVKDKINEGVEGVSAPPIKKIEESVKMTLGALIAEADKRGIDRIVLPPFERIVERRFAVGTEGYKKALDPKNGFYKTYVKSWNEAIKELQDEVGVGKISTRPIDMDYDTNPMLQVAESLNHGMSYSPDNGWADFLENDLHGELRAYYRGENSSLDDSDFYVIQRRLKQAGLSDGELRDYAASRFKPLSTVIKDKTVFGLPTTGQELNIKGLRESGYDLRQLRMAEGGMVEDNQMNRLMAEGGITDDGMNIEPVTGNEVPPGSLASEVRDDIPAKLSEGEYVVPADVVRYFGVRFFEDLRMQAKQGLAQMDADGRIGGATVNANGVPMEEEEDDEELSPEEEQMLMEALGSGMAYGGVVKGMAEGGISQRDPAFGARSFDRGNFSLPQAGGIETRVYYNPSTKEKKSIQFVGGNPVGAIPAGFVPYTEGMETQAPVTPVATTVAPEPAQDNSGGGSGMTAPTSTGQGASAGFNYNDWAEKNREAITSNPYQFGLDALADTTGKGLSMGLGVVGLAANAPAALLGAGVSKGYNAGQNIAEARAALQVMEAQGNADTAEYKSLEKQINKAISDLPGIAELAVKNDFAATGNNYFKALTKTALTGKPTTTSTRANNTKPTTTPQGRNAASPTPAPTSNRDRQDGAWSTPSTSSSSSGRSLVGNKPTGSSNVSSMVSAVKEKASTKPASKPAASSRMTGGAGRAEGGLVEKGAKAKRKGLASK